MASDTGERPSRPSRLKRTAVVVIDDNDELRVMVSRALRGAGYHVLDWANPMGAIEHLTNTTESVALILVDGVMPQMLGPLVANEIERVRPGVPIMLMSGHEAGMFSEFFGKPGRHFIAKPFVLADLLGRITALAPPTPVST